MHTFGVDGVALVMAAMMLAMAVPAFAAPKFGSPGEEGHPTCTKAEPHSPAIEPTEGGDLECNVFPPGRER
jgi:TRAP-type C4-dicarboxylate transport system substrate-binding protein